uniref:AAA domain-containing protein n=1 Tax=Heterorhabditis bacteriophora TaxID=37862 RepID=A0A1I7XTA8_HETBA
MLQQMQSVCGLNVWHGSSGGLHCLGLSGRRRNVTSPKTGGRLSNSYLSLFRQIGTQHVRNAFSQNNILINHRLLRHSRFRFTLADHVTIDIIPATGAILIQQRGFRTKRVASPMTSSGSLQKTAEGSGKWNIVSNLLMKKGKDESTEKWLQYDSDVKKLPEAQQKTYADGFVKGLLTSKPTAANSKKPNVLTRLYIFLVICIFLAYLTGKHLYLFALAIRVRIGDRQLGSLFFSNTQEVKPEDVQVTFEDVRGMDEAKMEVEEIVSYLRDPEKYSRLGGRLPKGVLLVGPPGTGKTLLARAIAGEAQVPFFHTSGSEFDEVLVGQGARRVRDLFDKAKARSPCIIFIDEIDSVGSKRALLRPGRFDVRVTVPKPDLAGRKDIFDFYLQRIIHANCVDPHVLAKGSTGFTGADIENMVNQAALKAATENAVEVTMHHLDEARDR